MKDKIYKEFDYKTDEGYYWISVLCMNCRQSQQIAIKKSIAVNSSRLKLMNCPRCEVRGTLKRADWDGNRYQVVKD